MGHRAPLWKIHSRARINISFTVGVHINNSLLLIAAAHQMKKLNYPLRIEVMVYKHTNITLGATDLWHVISLAD